MFNLLRALRVRLLARRVREPVAPFPDLDNLPEADDVTTEEAYPPVQPDDTILLDPAEPWFIQELRKRKHRVFVDRLNLIGVRYLPARSDRFDDTMIAAWFEDGAWHSRMWACTTDPTAHWLEYPMRDSGTLVMAPGQYIDAYKRGLHKGRPALIQIEPVGGHRDPNRDRLPETIGAIEFGYYGANIHDLPAGSNLAYASAGCQVLMTDDLDELLEIVEARGGGTVTYTLIEMSN